MTDMFNERNLRWLGHVQRMEQRRLPRQPLYYQFSCGKISQERMLIRFKETVKRNIKWRGIDPNQWPDAAEDRISWKNKMNDAQLIG